MASKHQYGLPHGPIAENGLAPLTRWPALDGLRAIAVGLVMVGHYGHRTEVGSVGVAAFYVLSGFLITWLLEREFAASRSVDVPAFYRRRILRIFPAYYVFLLVSFAFLPIMGIALGADEWFASAFYMSDYYSALHYRPSTPLTHTWSLGIEEKFYLVWPLLFLALRRRSIRHVRLALAVVIALVMIWRGWLLLSAGVRPHYVQFAFDTRADYLAIGCLLATCIGTAAYSRAPTLAARHSGLPLATTAFLTVLTFTISRSKVYWLSFPLEYFLLALLVLQLIYSSPKSPWRWLNHPIMQWLGMISYPMYLYHKNAWLIAQKVVGDPLWSGIVAAMLTIPLAAASYYLIERWFLGSRYRRLSPLAPAIHPQRQA